MSAIQPMLNLSKSMGAQDILGVFQYQQTTPRYWFINSPDGGFSRATWNGLNAATGSVGATTLTAGGFKYTRGVLRHSELDDDETYYHEIMKEVA